MAGVLGEVKITITPPSGDAMVQMVSTMDDGSFAAEFVAELEGTYNVLAEFAGNDSFLASSATVDVVVVPLPPVPVATTLTLNGPVDPVKVGDTVNIIGSLVS
jgi:hypothetical protein